METRPYYENYLKQGSKCFVCSMEITPKEYCVINTPEGIRVIHQKCIGNVKVGGCYAQIEVIYENK